MKSTIENLAVAKKLAFLVGIPLLLLLVVAGLTSRDLNEAKHFVAVESTKSTVGMYNAGELRSHLYKVISWTFRSLATKDPNVKATVDKQLDDNIKDIEEHRGNLKTAAQGTSRESEVTFVSGQIDSLLAAVQAARAGATDKVGTAKSAQSFEEFLVKFDKALEDREEKISEGYHDTSLKDNTKSVASLDRTAVVLWSATAFSFLAATFVFFQIKKSFDGPVKAFTDRMVSVRDHCATNLEAGIRALAAGDLTYDVQPATSALPTGRKDEFGKLSDLFNEVLAKLQAAIGSYNDSRFSLSDLVRHVSQQATDVQETSAGVAAAASQSGNAATEIAEASQRLAQGATDAAGVMDTLNNEVNQVGQGSRNQAKLIADTEAVLEKAGEGITGVAGAAQQVSALA
ncbi:MAG: methyl-accepting chemotaxis protein, partial [Armatimonadetes bacterium]|nr:methyl-accepting chemotaxis protein [Armatimonadota bacterium]